MYIVIGVNLGFWIEKNSEMELIGMEKVEKKIKRL